MAKTTEKKTKPNDAPIEESLIVEPQWRPVPGYLSSGCTLLDLAITNTLPGGFPMGRITHIYGAEASAKTVIALEPLGDVIRKGGIAYYLDAEATFDPDFAKLFGINANDTTHFRYGVPESIEDFFDNHIARIVEEQEARKEPVPICVALDTLTVLPSAKNEIGTKKDKKMLMDGESRGARAKPIGAGFRRWAQILNRAGITLIIIDQVRTNPAITYGDSDVTPGGRSLPFYASTRIKMKLVGDVVNAKEVIVGVDIGFSVKKNKVGPPMRGAEFPIIFSYGIDDIAANLRFLLKHKWPKLESSGAWYAWGDVRLGQGIVKAVVGVEDNDLELEVRDEVVKCWADIHAMPNRKEKRRG